MKFEVLSIPRFDQLFKRLAKKYPSIKNDLFQLTEALKENPISGTPIGNSCYKIRLAISSKSKGKSGGGRVITHVKVTKNSVFLLSIYDKSEQEDISDKQLSALLRELPEM